MRWSQKESEWRIYRLVGWLRSISWLTPQWIIHPPPPQTTDQSPPDDYTLPCPVSIRILPYPFRFPVNCFTIYHTFPFHLPIQCTHLLLARNSSAVSTSVHSPLTPFHIHPSYSPLLQSEISHVFHHLPDHFLDSTFVSSLSSLSRSILYYCKVLLTHSLSSPRKLRYTKNRFLFLYDCCSWPIVQSILTIPLAIIVLRILRPFGAMWMNFTNFTNLWMNFTNWLLMELSQQNQYG